MSMIGKLGKFEFEEAFGKLVKKGKEMKEPDDELIDEDLLDEAFIDEDDEEYIEKKKPPSLIHRISNANVVISLNRDDELEIIKNRNFEGPNALGANEALEFLSQIISGLVVKNNETLKLFKPTIQEEAKEECKKMLTKWGIEIIDPSIAEEDVAEDEYDDVPF